MLSPCLAILLKQLISYFVHVIRRQKNKNLLFFYLNSGKNFLEFNQVYTQVKCWYCELVKINTWFVCKYIVLCYGHRARKNTVQRDATPTVTRCNTQYLPVKKKRKKGGFRNKTCMNKIFIDVRKRIKEIEN